MSEFSWRETFVQPAFIPLNFVTFEKRAFTISDEQRDKEQERAREQRR